MISANTAAASAYTVTAGDRGSPQATREAGSRDGAASTASAALVSLSDESRLLAELAARDREVRTHEAAHVAAGGDLVRGAASYTFQSGPDGRRYATGGEVSIDISPASTPEETLAKANQIRAAALAPAEPSVQDRQVAAQAAAMAQQARAEIATRQAAGYRADEGPAAGSAIDAFA